MLSFAIHGPLARIVVRGGLRFELQLLVRQRDTSAKKISADIMATAGLTATGVKRGDLRPGSTLYRSMLKYVGAVHFAFCNVAHFGVNTQTDFLTAILFRLIRKISWLRQVKATSQSGNVVFVAAHETQRL